MFKKMLTTLMFLDITAYNFNKRLFINCYNSGVRKSKIDCPNVFHEATGYKMLIEFSLNTNYFVVKHPYYFEFK